MDSDGAEALRAEMGQDGVAETPRLEKLAARPADRLLIARSRTLLLMNK